MPRLKSDWVHAANDGGTAFRIATALAGLHGQDHDNPARTKLPMTMHFAPVDDAQPDKWTEARSHAVLWNQGALTDNLYEVFRRRLLDAERTALVDKPLAYFASAPLACVAEWLVSPQLDAQIDALLRGLVLTRIPQLASRDRPQVMPLPSAYALLKPLFCTDAQLNDSGLLDANQSLTLPNALLTRLWQGRFDGAQGVLRAAQRRLHIAGVPLSINGLTASGIDPRRLLMALLVPLDNRDLLHLVKPLRAAARNSVSVVTA